MVLSKCSKGVTVIQAAIVLPLLLMLVLVLIDIAIYFTAQGLVDTAASQAAEVSAIVPGLDDQDSTRRSNALDEIRQAAFDFGSNTMIQPVGSNKLFEFRVPGTGETPTRFNLAPFEAPGNDTSPVQVRFPFDYSAAQPRLDSNPHYVKSQLADKPIEVVVHADVRTIFLGYLLGQPDLKVTGRAIAYREFKDAPGAATVNPCGSAGNVSGGACECDGLKTRDDYGQCRCPGDYVDIAGICMCPGLATDPNGDFSCSDPVCPAGTVLNEQTKFCDALTCPGVNMTIDGDGNCSCNTDACQIGNKIQDLSTCACKDCPSGTMRASEGNFCHACSSNQEWDNLSCPSGSYKDPGSCTCKTCDNSAGSYYRVDSATGSCTCDYISKNKADMDRGEFQYFDFSTCRIKDCWGARKADPSGTSCTCLSHPDGIAEAIAKGAHWIFQDYNGLCRFWDCSDGGNIIRTANADRRRCSCPLPPGGECPDGEFQDFADCLCKPEAACGAGENDNRTLGEDGKCNCSNWADKSTCASNEFFHSGRCECRECEWNSVPDPNQTRCINCSLEGKIADPSNSFCICDPSVKDTCAAGERVDPATCTCTSCPPGKKPTEDSSSCECEDVGCPGQDPVTCECPPCPAGTVFSSTDNLYCCRKLGYNYIVETNICVEFLQVKHGYTKKQAKKTCKDHPVFKNKKSVVCSHCDPASQNCGNVSLGCLSGTETCEITVIED